MLCVFVDTTIPAGSVAFDDSDGFFNSDEAASAGPAFTITISAPNDQMGDPESSPVKYTFVITDANMNSINGSGTVALTSGDMYSPPSPPVAVTEGSPFPLVDGVLTLVVTLTDVAGNTAVVLPDVVITMGTLTVHRDFCVV